MGYDILPHTADLRLRVRSNSLEEMFRDALRGMFAAAEPRLARNHAEPDAEPRRTRRVRVTSLDREALLVDFLSEALTLGEEHRETYDDVVFTSLTDTALDATLSGFKRASVGLQVKAVTHHGLTVEERDSAFEATIVFDI